MYTKNCSNATHTWIDLQLVFGVDTSRFFAMETFSLNIVKTCCLYVVEEKQGRIWAKIFASPKTCTPVHLCQKRKRIKKQNFESFPQMLPKFKIPWKILQLCVRNKNKHFEHPVKIISTDTEICRCDNFVRYVLIAWLFSRSVSDNLLIVTWRHLLTCFRFSPFRTMFLCWIRLQFSS